MKNRYVFAILFVMLIAYWSYMVHLVIAMKA